MILTKKGKNNLLYRGYTANGSLSATENLIPTKLKIGINNSDPTENDTSMTYDIPISDGDIVDNGSTTLTGSDGGTNSTDNPTIYKEGGGETDNTAQNLIPNTSNTSKYWQIGSLTIDETKPYGFWLYIDSQTILNTFRTSDYCLRIFFLTVTGSPTYFQDFEYTDLEVGWNWITSNKDKINQLEGDSGVITQFAINIITKNATDVWDEGGVVYDLLRQWDDDDLITDFVTGYPALNENTQNVTIQSYITSSEANGFFINSIGIFNEDDTPQLHTIGKYSGESKSSLDEFLYIIKNRIL
jgi:hypothetical protein